MSLGDGDSDSSISPEWEWAFVYLLSRCGAGKSDATPCVWRRAIITLCCGYRQQNGGFHRKYATKKKKDKKSGQLLLYLCVCALKLRFQTPSKEIVGDGVRFQRGSPRVGCFKTLKMKGLRFSAIYSVILLSSPLSECACVCVSVFSSFCFFVVFSF